jgi:hypothetical protein
MDCLADEFLGAARHVARSMAVDAYSGAPTAHLPTCSVACNGAARVSGGAATHKSGSAPPTPVTCAAPTRGLLLLLVPLQLPPNAKTEQFVALCNIRFCTSVK